MLSVRIFIVLLLPVALQGCSMGISDIFSAATASPTVAENIEVERVKTIYKFQGRLKTEDTTAPKDASS